jgi:hypothetical protein
MQVRVKIEIGILDPPGMADAERDVNETPAHWWQEVKAIVN